MSKKLPPEHRKVLKKQPGWIKYDVPGIAGVKAYFNGTPEQLQRHIADIIDRRGRKYALGRSTAHTISDKRRQEQHAN